MKKIVSVILTFVIMSTQVLCITSFSEGAVYDYSSFCGEWHKIDPDELNGDVILDIIEVKNNNRIRFSLDYGDIHEETIYNNQVTWSEDWDDGLIDLTLTFYDDRIHLQYSRYSHEWYPEITFVSSIISPKRLESECFVILDGKELTFDQSPIIVDGRTLVPLRAIFEELGATVKWDGNTQTVISTKGQTTISMSIGKTEMYKNGKLITLDVVPQLVGGRTLVPVRAVAEGFDCKVEWDGNTQTVFIVTKSEISEPYKEIANYASNLCFIVEEQGGEEYFNERISNNELVYDALNELDDAIDFQETVLTLEGGALEISKTVLKFATGNYAGATKEIAGALVSSGSDVMFAALKKSVPDMKSFIYNMGITACEKQQFDIDNLKLLHSKLKSGEYTEGDAVSYIYLYYQMMINNENSKLSISLLQNELPQGFLESLKVSLKEAAGVFMPSISGDLLDLDLPTEVMMSILEEYASFVCGETNDFYAKMLENINDPAVKEWSENVQSYTNAINEKLSTIK